MKVERTKLDPVFKSDTPVLPNVKIINEWAYYDGPLFGICEVNGQQLFFMDIVFDVWREYKDGAHERLWCIFGVYDIVIEDAEKIIDTYDGRSTWQEEIVSASDCIGIFWEYEKHED